MILKGPKGTYGIGTRSVPAGVKPDRKPLGVIGSTGNAPTGGEHLHFEMAIETLGNKADKIYTNTVKAVLKARTEFLTNMLLLKMTKTGGQLKADPKAAASSQLSEAWKKKLRGKIKVKVDGKVTVIDVNKAKAIDVINAMKKSHTITSKFREWFTDADDFIEKGRSKHKRFAVHPLMFFTPEQLVDNPNQKSGRMGVRVGSRFAGTGRRKGLVIEDSKDSLCKKLGAKGLAKLRLSKTIERADKDRKAKGSKGTVPAAKKRKQSQKKRRKDERRKERKHIKKTAMIRTERLEGALHASVDQNLKYDTGNNPNQEDAWRAQNLTFPSSLV